MGKWIKRVLCALRGHGGIGPVEDCAARCKRCGSTVDIRPRQWRKGGDRHD